MERSGPDDARDDERNAPDDGWDDDATIYPAAPVPAHERTWRHPSEIGQTAWTASEPPVAIGRGLLVTSGAIGSALGVAVLYLLLPAGASSPSASPSVTSSTVSIRPPVVTVAEQPAVTSMLLGEPTTVRIDGPGLTLPAPDTPSTVLVMSVEAPEREPLSVAVSIEGAPYVVTTANALDTIGATESIDLLGPGDVAFTPRMAAELVSIEGDLAYLAPSEDMEVVSFAATATAEAGQMVTVLADDPTEVEYVDAGTLGGVPELDAGRIVEGTPVIDDQGALVALCTVVIDADGAHVELIPVVAPTTDPITPTSSDPDDTDADGTDADGATGGSTDDSGAASDPSATSGAATPIGTDRPSTTTTVSSAASAPVTTTSTAPSSASVATAPTAWAGLRFDGAPGAAPLTVTGVVAGSPAMAAGVMVGERVTAIDGVEVASVDDVVAAIKRHQPGEVMKLTLASRATAPSGTAASSATTTTTATTTTASGSSGGSTGSTGSTGSIGSSGGTRTISVVLAAYAPTV